MEVKIVYNDLLYNIFINGKFIANTVDYEDALDILKKYFQIKEDNNNEKDLKNT